MSWSTHGTRTCIMRKKLPMVNFLIFVQKNVSRIRFQEIKIKPFHGRILISWNLILDTFFCTKIKKFTIAHFFSLDACSGPMWPLDHIWHPYLVIFGHICPYLGACLSAPNMVNGVSLKRSSKMQFRCADFMTIGLPSQKL